jgi:hypothetical protein
MSDGADAGYHTSSYEPLVVLRRPTMVTPPRWWIPTGRFANTRRPLTGIGVVLLVCIASVRSGAQLVDNNNGTVTDSKTGKMWTKGFADGGALRDWNATRAWLPTYTFATHSDWRLPAVPCTPGCGGGEMMELYDRYRLIPYSNGMPFDVGGTVWTATEDPRNAANAIMYNTDDPGYASRAKTAPLRAWLVRDAGGPFPVAIDVWLADCGDDRGTVPSTSSCPRPFESIDIFVDNGDDDVMDAVTYGGSNRFEARVRNNSTAWTMWTTVRFYRQDCALGRTFPQANAVQLGSEQYLPANRPNGQLRVGATGQVPARPPGSDWCIGVVLGHPDDGGVGVPQPTDVFASNNFAAASAAFISQWSGKKVGDTRWTRWGWITLVIMSVAITYLITRRIYRRP